MISAEIICDSVNPCGNRLTTMLFTYPRFILAELNTHRMLSKNSASSRAIPTARMRESILKEPALPIAWGSNKPGMQAGAELDPKNTEICRSEWFGLMETALEANIRLESIGLHKQVANRILEPWMWMHTIVSATEWTNFFALRVHKDAQPEFQKLAYEALKVYLGSTPKVLRAGEWHLPLIQDGEKIEEDLKPLVSTARCARVSYARQFEALLLEKELALAERLATSGHFSPFEHPAMALESSIRLGNFVGWEQLRKSYMGENRTVDLHRLLADYEASLC